MNDTEQRARELLLQLDPVVPSVDRFWQDNWTLPHLLSKDVRDLGWDAVKQSPYAKGMLEWAMGIIRRQAEAEAEWQRERERLRELLTGLAESLESEAATYKRLASTHYQAECDGQVFDGFAGDVRNLLSTLTKAGEP